MYFFLPKIALCKIDLRFGALKLSHLDLSEGLTYLF